MVDLTKFRMKILHAKETIPQILDFKYISKNGIFSINNVVDFLNITNEESVSLSIEDEVLLSTKSTGVHLSILPNNKLQLPNYVLQKLGITEKTKICLIKRPNAVALKKFELNVVEAEFPRIIDLESTFTVTRQVETFSDPYNLYDKIKDSAVNFSLKYDFKNIWKESQSLVGWKIRKLLDIEHTNDKDWQIDFIQQRLDTQSSNGSWDEKLPLTAKMLIELNELGLNSNHPRIQKAISWLMDQQQSPHNPGMFFLSEDLVQKQIEIVDQRLDQTSGSRPRFRNRVKSEMNQIIEVDDLYYNPCGQRIMWVNALAMEALLAYGYEFHDRLQTALNTLTYKRWCECTYQYGLSDLENKESTSIQDIEVLYKNTMKEFKQGGVLNLDILGSIPTQTFMLRLEEKNLKNHTEYELRMPMPQQGCEYITTNALSRVKDERISRLIEAHLWRFIVLLFNAIRQPIMAIEGERNSLTIYFQLRVLAKYDSLPAKLGILFALPWIIENQNLDGTWGESKYRNSATLAILEALTRIDFI